MCKQDTTNLFLSFRLLLVSETLPACVHVSWVIHMRSASFCLVKRQETQLSSKQEVKIAEDILLLSTLKPGIDSA